MIRINLLPVRAAKKKESIRFQLTVAGLVTFLVVAVSMAAYLVVRSEASSLKDQISSGQQELEQLKKKIGELSKIKEQKRVVEEKLNIITELEANKTGPVKLFQRVSAAMPDKAWIRTLREDGAMIAIDGFAADDEIVADAMRGLERSGLGTVELDVAQRVVEKETGVEVVSFVIRVERQAPPKPEEKK
jgi:type IV pilus assembly protein PilN